MNPVGIQETTTLLLTVEVPQVVPDAYGQGKVSGF